MRRCDTTLTPANESCPSLQRLQDCAEVIASRSVSAWSQTLQALLKAGARVTARDQLGFTALHHSAQAGHRTTLEFLLGLSSSMRMARAPLESESNAEERPLHLAAQGGHVETVRLLLQHGAHPCKTNYMGQTPLHLAVLGGDSVACLGDTASRSSRHLIHEFILSGKSPTTAIRAA